LGGLLKLAVREINVKETGKIINTMEKFKYEG
jgi:hypothetical protein